MLIMLVGDFRVRALARKVVRDLQDDGFMARDIGLTVLDAGRGAQVALHCDATRAERALSIMRACGATAVEHRVELWQQGGWRTDFAGAGQRDTDERRYR